MANKNVTARKYTGQCVVCNDPLPFRHQRYCEKCRSKVDGGIGHLPIEEHRRRVFEMFPEARDDLVWLLLNWPAYQREMGIERLFEKKGDAT